MSKTKKIIAYLLTLTMFVGVFNFSLYSSKADETIEENTLNTSEETTDVSLYEENEETYEDITSETVTVETLIEDDETTDESTSEQGASEEISTEEALNEQNFRGRGI